MYFGSPEKFAAYLAKTPAIAKISMNEKMRITAHAISSRIFWNIRKLSWQTAKSVTVEPITGGMAPGVKGPATGFSIGPEHFVARFREYGTVRQRAFPFVNKSIVEAGGPYFPLLQKIEVGL